MISKRYQDLSREQAFGLEARILQRLARFLVVRDDANGGDVEAFFSSLLKLTYTLAEVSLGNISLKNARAFGKECYGLIKPQRLFKKESDPAASAICCVTDALGELELVRYFFAPGLAECDRRFPDVPNLIGSVGLTLSKMGIVATTFDEPAQIDCALILKTRKAGFQYLTPEFFFRPLWPTVNHPESNEGMPFVLEHVIFEDWRTALQTLGLGGVAVSYDGCLSGISLTQKEGPTSGDRAMVTNNVTLNFSNGSSFTGPLAVGQNIKLSYEAAAAETKADLKDRLDDAVKEVSKLVEVLESEEEKIDV